MPTVAPFSSPSMATTNNALFPALYLYPLNGSWAPKHISLTNQHTKIGRQTSSKTAPGERNGFFDSKVLSRQHAEVWEEGGKIFIKDVKSSNGTFINGERLSSEGHESEPFELKSDDIVEFGIDIVGEDNTTIVHHKVAARVVCVFSEQDAQVAARAEQHQQQQQLQQQQYLQQASGSSPSMGGPGGPGSVVNGGIVGNPMGVNNGSGGPQNFPFVAQRRAQLAQQGLGGMGGMRPPGKSGLSFDVILSRLQGELQKSRETGAELNSLTGAMNDIHDTLGGAVPANLPPFPSTLPPVRPPQDAHPPTAPGSSASHSPEQPSSQSAPAVSASAVLDLQSQLRDTQSSLASHLDKVRALEGVLAEQETMKREVRTLREMMEERRREMEIERAQQEERVRREVEDSRRAEMPHHEQDEEPRGGFDLEEEEDEREEDDDDDVRSVGTIMAHELERVDEEDEEQLAEEERNQQHHDDGTNHHDAAKEEHPQSEAEAQAEEEERRREDLGVGRPRTPEPSRLGLLGAPRRSSLSSPLSQISSSELRNGTTTDDVFEQVVKLSKQVGAVMALTTSLEAQHSAAQTTIQALETKVESLEEMLRATEEALARSQQQTQASPTKEFVAAAEPKEAAPASLVDMMSEWKKSVQGQWGSVQEEWTQERERLSKAREDWEAKLRQVDSGLEKMASMQSTIVSQQQQIQVQLQHQQQLQQQQGLAHPFHHLNGDALKHNGGLVTPPSPRSQSSDSGRYRRRRRRSSGSRGRSSSGERAAGSVEGEEDPDTDATLASSTEDDVEAKMRLLANGKALEVGHAAERSYATPEPSVYKLSSSIASLNSDPNHKSKARSNSDDTASPKFFVLLRKIMLMVLVVLQDASVGSFSSSPLAGSAVSSAADGSELRPPTINMQTAVGVVLLSVAAAAVFWKVKPE